MRLTFEDHNRDISGLRYVYPVVSRRAQGVSIGINLNPNNACNFRCVYCQVPDLVLGKAPEIDFELLESELDSFLEWITRGDFMERVVPEGMQRLNDLAFSGNGEPTSAQRFDEIVELVGRQMQKHGLVHAAKLVLITNGSLAAQEVVRRGIERMQPLGGEVWFKLDSATDAGLRRINDYAGGVEKVKKNLAAAAPLCPTWLQSCVFAFDGNAPDATEQEAYLDFLRWTRSANIPLEGVLLYGIARKSYQPEAPRLTRLDGAWLEAWAERIRALDFVVRVSP